MLFNHYCLKKYVVVCPPSRVLSYIFIVVLMMMMMTKHVNIVAIWMDPFQRAHAQPAASHMA